MDEDIRNSEQEIAAREDFDAAVALENTPMTAEEEAAVEAFEDGYDRWLAALSASSTTVSEGSAGAESSGSDPVLPPPGPSTPGTSLASVEVETASSYGDEVRTRPVTPSGHLAPTGRDCATADAAGALGSPSLLCRRHSAGRRRRGARLRRAAHAGAGAPRRPCLLARAPISCSRAAALWRVWRGGVLG